MPIYKYRCRAGHEFEIYQKLHEGRLQRCKECGEPVTRLINAYGYMRLWNGTGVWLFDRQGKSPDWER